MNAALVLLLAAAATGPEDPVRRAMTDELARTMKELRIPNEPAPHHVTYVITDVEQAGAGATFGARTATVPRRWRNLRVAVRVGDRTFDSGNFLDTGAFISDGVYSAPLEDDYLALRRDLWLRTDEAFKRAVDAIGKKRAAEKAQARGEDDAPFDFAEAKPVEHVTADGPREPLDPEAVARIVTELSGLFREIPGIHASRASGEQLLIRQRLITSDGAWKDERRSLVELSVNAETQAEDGMPLRSGCSFQAPTLAALPPLPEMVATVKAMAAELAAARKAPTSDNGTAVVLFEGRAAGQLLRGLLAGPLSGTPPPRVPAGSRNPTPSELAGRLNQKVAPAFLDVYDDPRTSVGAGPAKPPLLGAYQVDDEGIPAERVSLIEKGMLKSLLMSRTPRKELTRSNGHGRGRATAGAVRGKAGVLYVSAGKAGLTEAALRARAVKEARQTGKDIPVFIVRHLDPNAPSVRPLRVFRLRDGKEEPVRGITFQSLLPRSLKDIVALGKDPTVYNYLSTMEGHVTAGGAPGTIVTPSVVFKDVEVKKDTDKNPRPPLYPHPHFAEK